MILKNLTKNYTTIPNELITDNLSHGAFRLYCYLASKPETWEVYNNDIRKQLNIGRDGLAKYWKELINAGWVEKNPEKDKSGKFTGKTILILNNFKNTDITESGEKPNAGLDGKRGKTECGKTQPLSNTKPISKTDFNINNKKEYKEKTAHTLFKNLSISEKYYKYLDQDIIYLLRDLGDNGELVEDFINYRNEIKNSIKTNRPLKSYLRELLRVKNDLGVNIYQAVEIMQENEWNTLKMEWIKNRLQNNKANLRNIDVKEEKILQRAKKAIDDFVNDN